MDDLTDLKFGHWHVVKDTGKRCHGVDILPSLKEGDSYGLKPRLD
jgi:hypothetical protein